MADGGFDSGGFVGSTFDTSHHQNNVHSSIVIAGSGETFNGSSRLNTNMDMDTNTNTNICGIILVVSFFLVWFGVSGFMAVMFALNVSPFLAIGPIAMSVIVCICIVSACHSHRQNQNSTRTQPRNEGTDFNINHDSSSHAAHPPQTSNVPLGFHDQSLHFATNYGFHATLINPGMQYSTASAGQTSQPSNVSTSMASDLPPSYEEVTKGKQTEGKFEGRL
ncbi:hypothetical protein BSL78_17780 [Apostichopus japonicus]|uniref:Transmembrane protein n=1 Tax=Stichopus japonicus TaxID=307972 RepID=A0A2G8KBM2_STIJA|nr:hypothetical protein BSL78_17780 [Apostichopus japonicus]